VAHSWSVAQPHLASLRTFGGASAKMDSHVQYILSKCAQWTHLLKLQQKGMPSN